MMLFVFQNEKIDRILRSLFPPKKKTVLSVSFSMWHNKKQLLSMKNIPEEIDPLFNEKNTNEEYSRIIECYSMEKIGKKKIKTKFFGKENEPPKNLLVIRNHCCQLFHLFKWQN